VLGNILDVSFLRFLSGLFFSRGFVCVFHLQNILWNQDIGREFLAQNSGIQVFLQFIDTAAVRKLDLPEDITAISIIQPVILLIEFFVQV